MTNSSPELVALILAKKESKRLENKNSLLFKGDPMFIVNVRKCLKLFDRVYVSSDSEWMIQQAENEGAIGILRPEYLCDEVPNIPVYQHALSFIGKVDGIVAVQANSPTVEMNLIGLAKNLLSMGIDEIMTCHEDRSIYGSIWALSKRQLENYGSFYDPKPSVLIVDKSIDIHTLEDFNKALND